MDKINPNHYKARKYEAINIVEDTIKSQNLPPYEAFLVGVILQYLMRYHTKNGKEDLQKAEWYLKRLIKERERVEIIS
jgi:CRISPR/Cas system-associated protein Cas5 (RAMP superfamily)